MSSRVHAAVAFLALLFAACEGAKVDVAAAQTDGSDAAADADAAAPDVAEVADGGPDAAADAAPDVVPDAPADVADAGEVLEDAAVSCESLGGQIATAAQAANACTISAGCQTFEYPICNSFGCFQTPIAKDADVTLLSALASQAQKAGCPGFHCGCSVSTPSFCLGGHCRQCPPDCAGTCEETTAALLATAHANNWCGADADCIVVQTGMCPVGDLPCGGLFVGQNGDTPTLQALLGAYSAACGASTCKCKVPGPAVCVKGKCVAPGG